MACRDLHAYVVNGGSADNIPVDALSGANAPIRSDRSSKARTEADTSSERHPSPGVKSLFGSGLGSPSTLREPSPAPGTKFNTGIAFTAAPAFGRRSPWRRTGGPPMH